MRDSCDKVRSGACSVHGDVLLSAATEASAGLWVQILGSGRASRGRRDRPVRAAVVRLDTKLQAAQQV